MEPRRGCVEIRDGRERSRPEAGRGPRHEEIRCGPLREVVRRPQYRRCKRTRFR